MDRGGEGGVRAPLREGDDVSSGWEEFKRTDLYRNLALWADPATGGFTEDAMRQAFQAGERSALDRAAAELAGENYGWVGAPPDDEYFGELEEEYARRIRGLLD